MNASDQNMVERRSCEEFRSTGLLLFVNSFLHIFGWAIVVELIEGSESSVMYPARVKFRGFDNNSTSEAYVKVSQYIEKNCDELLKEAKE